MASPTFFSKTQAEGKLVFISFYKEQPGGWKLNFEDEFENYIPGGDRWVEHLDDLVLQIGNFTEDDLVWQEEGVTGLISFYNAVKRCIVG